MGVHELVLPPTTCFTWSDPTNNLLLLTLSGELSVNGTLHRGQVAVVAPAGRDTTVMVGALRSVHAIAVVREAPHPLAGPIVVARDDLMWLPLVEDGEQHFVLRDILTPDQVGLNAQELDYPARYTTVWHTHTHAHFIYVLEGVLRTHDGLFGPGSFVWGPAGQVMERGATDDANCRILFVTDKPFDLRYLPAEEIPQA